MYAVQIRDNADVMLGDFVFNTIDAFGVAWTITDIDGWFYMPESSAPDDPLPDIYDGSYDSSGRYLPRQITLTGTFCPPPNAAKWVVQDARERLIDAVNIVRSTDYFTVLEQPAKQSIVRYVGGMKIDTSSLNGVTTFSIPLRAADPRKYAVENSFSVAFPYSGSTIGRTYDLVYNRMYQAEDDGSSQDSSLITVVNQGSYSTGGVLTFNGPITNPGVEILDTGETLQFMGKIPQGVSLIVDLNYRTAKLDTGVDYRVNMRTDSEWFLFDTGVTSVRLLGSQEIGPAAGSPDTTNFVKNPSFDAAKYSVNSSVVVDAPYALNNTSGITAAVRYEGSSSNKISVDNLVYPGSGSGSILSISGLSNLAEAAGTNVTLSAFVKGDPAMGELPDGYGLYGQVEFRDLSNSIISSPMFPMTLQSGVSETLASSNTWSRIRSNESIPVPLNADHGSLAVGVYHSAGVYDNANYVLDPNFTNLSRWSSGTVPPMLSGVTGLSTTNSISTSSSTTVNNVSIRSSSASSTFGVSVPATPNGQYPPLSASCAVWLNSSAGISRNCILTAELYNRTGTLVQTVTSSFRIDPSTSPLYSIISTDTMLIDTSAGGFYGVLDVRLVRPGNLDASEKLVMSNPFFGVGQKFLYGDQVGNRWTGTANASQSSESLIRMYVDAVQLEPGENPSTYFNGYTPGAAWNGTPYDSISRRRAVVAIPKAQLNLNYRSAWL